MHQSVVAVDWWAINTDDPQHVSLCWPSGNERYSRYSTTAWDPDDRQCGHKDANNGGSCLWFTVGSTGCNAASKATHQCSSDIGKSLAHPYWKCRQCCHSVDCYAPFPSMLWYCWLDDKKGVWPGRNLIQRFAFGRLTLAWSHNSRKQGWLNINHNQ